MDSPQLDPLLALAKDCELLRPLANDSREFAFAAPLAIASAAARKEVEPHLAVGGEGLEFPLDGKLVRLTADAPAAAKAGAMFFIAHHNMSRQLKADGVSDATIQAIFNMGFITSDLIVTADTGRTIREVVVNQRKADLAGRLRSKGKTRLKPPIVKSAKARFEELRRAKHTQLGACTTIAQEIYREHGVEVTADAVLSAIKKADFIPQPKSLLEMAKVKLLKRQSKEGKDSS